MNTDEEHPPTHTIYSKGWRASRNRHAIGLRIELGRRRLELAGLGRLASGSVVELEAGATDDVDIYANGRLLARGQAVSVDGKLAVRVREVMATEIDRAVAGGAAERLRTEPT